MDFWIFMLAMDLLVPLSMILFGRLFLKNRQGNINAVFGYRTSMSMKNRQTWEFAHRHIGKLWFRIGLALLPVSVIPMLFVIGKDDGTVSGLGVVILMLQLIPMVLPIIATERALRRNFDQEGNAK